MAISLNGTPYPTLFERLHDFHLYAAYSLRSISALTETLRAKELYPVGEVLPMFVPSFNRSLVIEARPERLSSDAGAVLLRELLQRSGIIPWMVARLADPRASDQVTYPLAELLRTVLVLFGQGWRDQDDADALRFDPAVRLAVAEARGTAALGFGHHLPSQPTLSRLRLCCMDVERDGARTQYPQPDTLFSRYGHSSGVPAPAFGSGPRQRWRPRSPRSGQCATEGHRRSRACSGRSTPPPWPADYSCWLSAKPFGRVRLSSVDGGRAVSGRSRTKHSPLRPLVVAR